MGEPDLATVKESKSSSVLPAFYGQYLYNVNRHIGLGAMLCYTYSGRRNHADYYEFVRSGEGPNGVPLDLTQEEYEQFQEKELYLYQEEMSRYEAHVNFEDRKLNELEDQLDQLEQKVNEAN